MDARDIDLNASERFRLDVSTDGMRLIQDLVNTHVPEGAGQPDLLEDASLANAWLAVALRSWADAVGQPPPKLSLTDADLPALRKLRAQLQAWLADRTTPLAARERTFAIGLDEGRATYRPRHNGSDGVAALVNLELLVAERAHTPPRLKVCANPACRAAFHDNSKNMSRVWHDVKTCGNQANLRASRARQRGSRTA